MRHVSGLLDCKVNDYISVRLQCGKVIILCIASNLYVILLLNLPSAVFWKSMSEILFRDSYNAGFWFSCKLSLPVRELVTVYWKTPFLGQMALMCLF